MTRNPTLSLAQTQHLAAPAALPPPVRVAIVTDDALMRAGVQRLLSVAPEVAVTARPDAQVVLIDLGADRERATARLTELGKSAAPTIAVVPDATFTAAALAAGARGVVQRDSVGPEWSVAIVAVDRGLTVIDGPLVGPLVPVKAAAPPRAGTGALTERERQVVGLLAEGLSNKLIADRLKISDHTAKFHVNGVMAKLGAGTRTEAVVAAVRRGLVAL